MRKGKSKICSLCGKVIKPGGIGGHLRLAHHSNNFRELPPEQPDVSDDIPHDVPQHVCDISERIIINSTSENLKADYIHEALMLRKQHILIHSIKAPNENIMNEMIEKYIVTKGSQHYLQKHKVSENYWCCWVWKRREL